MKEGAAIRSMVQSDLLRPGWDKCTTCKGRALYVARWIYTKHGARSYSRAGGRPGTIPMQDYLCLECARKWAKDNSLQLCPSPLPDPAPGQIWKLISAPNLLVVITGWVDKEFGREITFEPSLVVLREEIDSLQPQRFMVLFDPVCEKVLL